MNPARLAAARVLVALDRGKTTLGAEAEKERSEIIAVRDRALFLEITAGTVRWRAELDACLAPHSSRPLADLTPEVRAVLRSGAYQILHLDRVPPHAAVSESVEVVRALRQSRAAGFVNAVLRKLTSRDPRRALPRRPASDSDRDAAIRYLSTTLSHPEWLVERWLQRAGFEATERWCTFNNTAPGVTIRAIPPATTESIAAALEQAGFQCTSSQLVPGALRLSTGAFGKIPDELRATFRIQEEGSQLIALATGAERRDKVLDVCAAPGGKTIVMSERVTEGLLVASDFRPARVSLLRQQLSHAGVRAPVLAVDATDALPFAEVFDRVLLDAPCSGLGTLRRDPDVKWLRQAADLPVFAATQLAMAMRAAAVVRPGGALIYATCSSEPEENDDVVDSLLSELKDFRIEPIEMDESTRPLITDRGFVRTRPDLHDMEAFFAAKLVRSRSA